MKYQRWLETLAREVVEVWGNLPESEAQELDEPMKRLRELLNIIDKEE